MSTRHTDVHLGAPQCGLQRVVHIVLSDFINC